MGVTVNPAPPQPADTELPAAAALADGVANPTVPTISVYPSGFNGTTWDRLRVDAAKNLLVSLNTLISGEDQTNGRLLVDAKPADADCVAELLQNAASSAVAGQPINLKGFRSATLEIAGTFVATVTFEGTLDDASWFTVALPSTQEGAPTPTATAPGAWKLPPDVCLSQLRARISAFTSGTVTVRSRKHAR